MADDALRASITERFRAANRRRRPFRRGAVQPAVNRDQLLSGMKVRSGQLSSPPRGGATSTRPQAGDELRRRISGAFRTARR